MLTIAGFAGARTESVVGDASSRSRLRLSKNGMTVILTNYLGDSIKGMLAFIKVSEYLNRIGLSAPRVFDCDIDEGVMLEEDFGRDNVFYDLVSFDPSKQKDLYLLAVDVLLHLHSSPALEGLALLDQEAIIGRLSVFVDQAFPFYGVDNDKLGADFIEIWKEVISISGLVPEVISLMDYHSPNLMWLSSNPDLESVGIIDFQDALLGYRAYDFISLAQDARYPVSEDLYATLIDHYIKGCAGEVDRDAFAMQCRVLGAFRACRIIGLFLYKYKVEKDFRYIRYIPILEHYLFANLSHPILQELSHFLRKVGMIF